MARPHGSLYGNYDKLPDCTPYLVELVQLETILELRRRILAPGQPAVFPEDCSPTTFHVAIFPPKRTHGLFSDKPVCCATLVLTDQVEGIPFYQLRGMATDLKWQKRGLGSRLLSWIEKYFCEQMIAMLKAPNIYLWCNARVSAVPFYEKQGWH